MGMMSNLPQGWASVPLKDIATVFLGKTPARSEYCSKGKYKVIKFRDLKSGLVDFSNAKNGYVMDKTEIVSSLKLLQEKDVLITSAAHSGENIGKKCAYIKRIPDQFEGVFFTGELLNIRAEYDETLAKWSYLYFLSAKGFKEIQSAVKGVHLTSGRANMMQIDIAPLNEQRRIVAKLEKLLQKIDACKERLDKIPTILKRFRQSILAAACSGRLTADWREKNPDVEPLKRIVNDYKGKIATTSFTYPMGNDIPESWILCNLGTLAELITKGSSPSWQGINYVDKGILFVTSKNVGSGHLILGNKKFVEGKFNQIQKRSILKRGDILTNIVGASIGRTAIFDLDEKANINQAVSLIRLKNKMSSNYILMVLNSPAIVDFMNSTKVDVARANLSLKDVASFPIPLPPITEQHKIVRRVEALFKIADQIEERYKKGKAYVDKLTQSILAKAFRGELVPQDPSDEPATILIKRIREERVRREAGMKDNKKNRRHNKHKQEKRELTHEKNV